MGAGKESRSAHGCRGREIEEHVQGKGDYHVTACKDLCHFISQPIFHCADIEHV